MECSADVGLVLFASSAARPDDAAEQVTSTLNLARELKTLQGQVLFSPTEDDTEALASKLLQLDTLDYVHVLLASSAVHERFYTLHTGVRCARAGSLETSAPRYSPPHKNSYGR